ncbi:MAG TPA: aspartate aminotransferase family protein [Acetobacteraceae bacterium]|nr:aspartate aminotransferase family protein [Acetobacteraceae bacterium]
MSTPSSGDVGRLREAVDRHLFRYTAAFAPWFAMRAKGTEIYDETGRAVLDFCSGQMCATLGHNHPAVTEAIERSCRDVVHLFSGLVSPPVVELAEELGALLPPALQKMMFMSTGSESNEAALRIAKMHTEGFEVIGLGGSWHGVTMGSNSSTYNGARAGYGPAAPGSMAIPGPNCYRCPIRHCRDACDTTCLDVGFELYDQQSVGAPAAVIAEPVLSSAGIIVPPEGYFVKLKEKAAERGMLLILDEAQTGLGRTGTNFMFEQLGMVPDVLTLSKTLGNGLPMAATITSDAIEADCHAKGFLFYTSHISDPLPAAVGLAVLRVMKEENLPERAARMGTYLMESLRTLQQRYECIGDVRGKGLLIGLEIVKDRESRQADRALASRIQRLCLEGGLVLHAVRQENQSAIRLAPPLTVTQAEMDRGIAIMDQAFRRALEPA